MHTADFDEVLSRYENSYPHSPFFETWVPREKFLTADFDSTGNISISREDDGIYGIALGASPAIPSDWKNFSLESRGIVALPDEFKAVVEWDSYWAPTIGGQEIAAATASDSDIDAFLKAHAPDSSVFPGNDEIIQWVEVISEGKLAAVAALCRWESGRVVISSVATHSELRGKGLGKQLMEMCLIAGHQLGEKYLCLGVRHQNESAQRLYKGVGFRLMHNFTYCERR
ncbi:MAG: GNAT family N-acetyltransferase [Candidatus Planktophila sp.]